MLELSLSPTTSRSRNKNVESQWRRDKFSKIDGMNARIVCLASTFNCSTDVEKRTERGMVLLTGKTIRRWCSELSVAPWGQKTKQSEVAGQYMYVANALQQRCRVLWRWTMEARYVSTASRNVIRSATTSSDYETGVWCDRYGVQQKLDALLLHSGRNEACLVTALVFKMTCQISLSKTLSSNLQKDSTLAEFNKMWIVA